MGKEAICRNQVNDHFRAVMLIPIRIDYISIVNEYVDIEEVWPGTWHGYGTSTYGTGNKQGRAALMFAAENDLPVPGTSIMHKNEWEHKAGRDVDLRVFGLFSVWGYAECMRSSFRAIYGTLHAVQGCA